MILFLIRAVKENQVWIEDLSELVIIAIWYPIASTDLQIITTYSALVIITRLPKEDHFEIRMRFLKFLEKSQRSFHNRMLFNFILKSGCFGIFVMVEVVLPAELTTERCFFGRPKCEVDIFGGCPQLLHFIYRKYQTNYLNFTNKRI